MSVISNRLYTYAQQDLFGLQTNELVPPNDYPKRTHSTYQYFFITGKLILTSGLAIQSVCKINLSLLPVSY
jgi:hypothetical protein